MVGRLGVGWGRRVEESSVLDLLSGRRLWDSHGCRILQSRESGLETHLADSRWDRQGRAQRIQLGRGCRGGWVTAFRPSVFSGFPLPSQPNLR